ncbi:hypothetical protein [Acinetobacter sp. CFCC 10889]|uniref:hypothetical protein n=1 Tax=Acinetobacter sp. CFCC 10889 TaxID=1775557 RepID=UPI000DD033EF|nr:hypothetical protein [Acinetobacter sp. CFCC 10889]
MKKRIFITVSGIVLMLLGILCFYILELFLGGIGASGTGYGGGSLLPIIVSAVPFTLGGWMIYWVNQNNDKVD